MAQRGHLGSPIDPEMPRYLIAAWMMSTATRPAPPRSATCTVRLIEARCGSSAMRRVPSTGPSPWTIRLCCIAWQLCRTAELYGVPSYAGFISMPTRSCQRSTSPLPRPSCSRWTSTAICSGSGASLLPYRRTRRCKPSPSTTKGVYGMLPATSSTRKRSGWTSLGTIWKHGPLKIRGPSATSASILWALCFGCGERSRAYSVRHFPPHH